MPNMTFSSKQYETLGCSGHSDTRWLNFDYRKTVLKNHENIPTIPDLMRTTATTCFRANILRLVYPWKNRQYPYLLTD